MKRNDCDLSSVFCIIYVKSMEMALRTTGYRRKRRFQLTLPVEHYLQL